MGKSTLKCVYKPDSMSTDEYIVLIGDSVALKKWKEGDKTIPLAEIVDSFDVFHTGQGAQGVMGRPSKQILESVFGSSKDDECVKIVLEKGQLKSTESPEKSASTNDARNAGYQVSAGSGGSNHGGR